MNDTENIQNIVETLLRIVVGFLVYLIIFGIIAFTTSDIDINQPFSMLWSPLILIFESPFYFIAFILCILICVFAFRGQSK